VRYYGLALVASLGTTLLILELLRRGQLREKYAALWLLIGAAVVVVGLAPGLLSPVSRAVGVRTPSNLLFFLAALVLLGVCLHLSWEVSRLEDETRRLAEEHAVLRLQVERLGPVLDGPAVDGQVVDSRVVDSPVVESRAWTARSSAARSWTAAVPLRDGVTRGVLAAAARLPRSTTAVAVGVGVLGLASFGYLVVAGRALGPERFGTVAIFWVVLNTLGAGLFLPLEQHVSRELAADADVDGRRVLRRALGLSAAVLGLLVAVAALLRDQLADALFAGSTGLVVALVAGTAAMAASYTCRGAFAGLGSWQRYGSHLAVDGVVRLAGACLLALAGSDSTLAYAAVVVVGLAVSVVVTVPGRRSRRRRPGGPVGRPRPDARLAAGRLGVRAGAAQRAPLGVELLSEGAGAPARRPPSATSSRR
jgi:hypothetical protein